MLSIRLQRVGRKGHAMYRVIVQDSHRQPTSGKIVAQIGTYDPHSKAVTINKEKAETYLKNGAQPTPRVVSLFKAEKIALPAWVTIPSNKKEKTIKNAAKLRRNQPKEEAAEAPVAEEAAEAPVAEEAATEPAVEAEAPTVEEAEKSVEQIAEAEVADGQETAEEE